jgi:hypothetical protein
MMWLLFTFALCLSAMIAARVTGSKTRHVAMAPFMAVAAVLAIGVYTPSTAATTGSSANLAWWSLAANMPNACSG